MTASEKQWQCVKADYIRNIEKALSSVNHPRIKEVLDDVASHLDRRFAELGENQQTWENFQAIITDMGPPSEYAELLDTDQKSKTKNTSPKLVISITVIVCVIIVLFIAVPLVISHINKPVTSEKFQENFSRNIDQFDIHQASLKDVIKTFGQPNEYVWGSQVFDRKNLPARFVIVYPNDFHISMNQNKIVEIRFEGTGTNYTFKGIRIGSSLDEVLDIIGEPKETIVGQKNWFEDQVLYKDIEDRKGHCYYSRTDQNVRFFFVNYKVRAFYITRSDYGQNR